MQTTLTVKVRYRNLIGQLPITSSESRVTLFFLHNLLVIVVDGLYNFQLFSCPCLPGSDPIYFGINLFLKLHYVCWFSDRQGICSIIF